MTENEFNLKCDECSLIPNFTLYNYIDCIKLNMICKENHSITCSLNDYIKNINNKKKKNFCSKCKEEKNEIIVCQFCEESICEECIINHFIIYHIFKNDIINEFINNNIFKDMENDEEINKIKEIMNKSINYLKEIKEYFKEIVNLFEDFMINNLNEILLIKMFYEDYINMKKKDIENSKVLYENILFLSKFNELKLDKRNFNEFLKNKNNYIINGNKYKGNIIDGEGEMDYFIGKYEGNFKNGIKEGYGKFIYKNGVYMMEIGKMILKKVMEG